LLEVSLPTNTPVLKALQTLKKTGHLQDLVQNTSTVLTLPIAHATVDASHSETKPPRTNGGKRVMETSGDKTKKYQKLRKTLNTESITKLTKLLVIF